MYRSEINTLKSTSNWLLTRTALVTVPLTARSVLTPLLHITADQPSFGFNGHLTPARKHQPDEYTRIHLFNIDANLNSI